MTALAVRGLNVDLGGRRVLHDVELTVEAGDFMGLIGPNGAGKTTLLRAVLGLVRPASGSIRVEGEPVGRVRQRVGYVPQRHEFAWDFPISVADAVLSGRVRRMGWLRRAGVADYRAAGAALARVGMTELADRPVGQLSGGQRQRVLVARALALRPRVLLLDEPFTGLDVPTQELLTDLFGALAGEGRAVLMTTHDLTAAVHSCGRLCLVNRTVVATGKPDELRDAEPWRAAFGIRAGSPLLAALGVN
ncbi:anchored repeat-type ABC transporter ATP-binding subunit [Streptomyces sp. 3MP-14]|uniref:Anchored repeat-type ABC transporter ATP-binding subunit n=1 Tax=Streptomyces mimosae TaxID=2586635 RepID=A0A5N5ZWV1_9ACTN|nr:MULTISPECIES: anchored repeat-type ABC transporter ATP-binding subunit [Streptomyces]KAB8160283.1 anchored repeat-type ABC transporter ATP-binding subunit [Streptomyces mimosae]KAB8172955.1 anchored repeat-type ABC transporter ATP-binding subunit [Streptomyces sp. 3MP-14]